MGDNRLGGFLSRDRSAPRTTDRFGLFLMTIGIGTEWPRPISEDCGLRIVMALTIFSALGIWAWGYQIEGGRMIPRLEVVIAHNVLGVMVLSGVVLGNVYWVTALERLPRWVMQL